MTPEEREGARLAAQSALYDQVIDSNVTRNAIEFLCRCQMLLKIAGDDLDAVLPVVHTPAGQEAARREYEQLADDERDELHTVVGQHWSLVVNLAVRRMFHAAQVLGFKADTLDPKHVAMVAATYISRTPEDVYAELVKAVDN
jgi:hypothetical protein